MGAQKYSVETELDKCIDALAETNARCMFRLDNGTCNRSMCSTCKINFNYSQAMAALQPVDTLRVENKSVAYYNDFAIRSRMHQAKRKIRAPQPKTIATVLKYAGIVFVLYTLLSTLLGLLPLLIMRAPRQTLGGKDNMPLVVGQTLESVKQEDEETYKLIWKLLVETEYNVSDRNCDGQVNCIDYSLTFKELYDNAVAIMYRRDCEIVRNVNNKTGMNHLFVRVKTKTGVWVHVETQYVMGSFIMFDVWKDQYNPRYNKYGETKYWLKRKIK